MFREQEGTRRLPDLNVRGTSPRPCDLADEHATFRAPEARRVNTTPAGTLRPGCSKFWC
jgi:hypothetical protein